MKKLRVLLLWLLLLIKRLYKKPAFWAILIIIPVVIFAYGLTSQEESGMITVVLSSQNTDDAFSESIINELKDSSDIIRFMVEEDASVAEEMVYNGVADAAWIISSSAKEDLGAFVKGRYTGKGFVRVVVRDETVPLLLANEKLSGRLFVSSAKVCFLQYLREDAALNEVSDGEIMGYFDGLAIEDDLFSYSYVSNSKNNANARNYLLMPVRGILSVLLMIGAMAAAMFYIADDSEGLFSWISLRRKPYVEFGCQVIALSNIMAVVLIAIFATGLHVSIVRELLISAVYVLCCAAFGQLVRMICRTRQCIGMVMPLLIMVMLVVCPVFISLPGMKLLQLLFPPTYYLNAVYNNAYLAYFVLYTFVIWLLCRLFPKRF